MRAFAPEGWIDRVVGRHAPVPVRDARACPMSETRISSDRLIHTRHLATEPLHLADFEDEFLLAMKPDDAMIGARDHHTAVGRARSAGPG